MPPPATRFNRATASPGPKATAALPDRPDPVGELRFKVELPGAIANPGAADKQFEELYDRLKRELMIEQEQLGQLFHEP